MKLTKAEKETLSRFFDNLEESHSNAICNDFRVKNTPGNRKMLAEAIKYTIKDKDDREEYLDDLNDKKSKEIITFDSIIFDYLRNKVEKILGIK